MADARPDHFAAAEIRIRLQCELYTELTQARDPRKSMADSMAALDCFIAMTPPKSLANCAVKLRRLLDPQLGLPAGKGECDVTSLAQILAFVEALAGKPAYLTRPTATDDTPAEPRAAVRGGDGHVIPFPRRLPLADD